MKASILTIGNELVSGFTLDTNSAWISQKLLTYNIQVEKVVSVNDNDTSIKNELSILSSCELDYLFITGGLGPTHDDITRNSIKDFYELVEGFDSNYYDVLRLRFKERGINISESNKTQAIIYHNCKMLPNPKGTARGLFIDSNGIKVFVLPGVPVEMKAIFENSILKYLPTEKISPTLTLRAFGISESSLAEKLSNILTFWQPQIKFAFLPSHLGVDLRLSNFDNPHIALNKVSDEIIESYGHYFYGINSDTLEKNVVNGLIKKKLTLSVAESCTGGQVANYITKVVGSSAVFLGGVVAYSNQLKIDFLGVSKNNLDEFGAVSEDVAIQMANGIRKNTKSDIGIGITGISGPTGESYEKPIGLVFIAISGNNFTKVKKFIIKIDRIMHQEMTAYIALNMIRRYYLEK